MDAPVGLSLTWLCGAWLTSIVATTWWLFSRTGYSKRITLSFLPRRWRNDKTASLQQHEDGELVDGSSFPLYMKIIMFHSYHIFMVNNLLFSLFVKPSSTIFANCTSCNSLEYYGEVYSDNVIQ